MVCSPSLFTLIFYRTRGYEIGEKSRTSIGGTFVVHTGYVTLIRKARRTTFFIAASRREQAFVRQTFRARSII